MSLFLLLNINAITLKLKSWYRFLLKNRPQLEKFGQREPSPKSFLMSTTPAMRIAITIAPSPK